ncbi:DUF2935 domain-containing protein [Desmospora profundinema]|uniref:DUF2935 domain-containing protein n=1 Tax=Desmospora profundinema TaxID=1571184 RepID=A0ABU1IMT2_9BACL|nr:DUF2935 domain-containing protein [Desmospora profundinema]MDR6226076.1 hypothetical protein [Desmospora profundinema]
MKASFEKESAFEHRFWLQVLGDHARFIRDSLSPIEAEEVRKATAFIEIFDRLLNQSRQALSAEGWIALAKEAHQASCQIRTFKLHLIQRHLTESIQLQLSPTFLNHMVNEVEEYIRVLKYLSKGEVPPLQNPIHHHLVWLLDAAGHAGAIQDNMDLVEKRLKKKSHQFMTHFEQFYIKAVELAGYMRTCLHHFPALDRFNSQVELEIAVFKRFLAELEEMRLTKQALGVLAPLMADHMAREECYYLIKLSQVSHVRPPDCDPASPRREA